MRAQTHHQRRPRVLIAGGGVAGLETLLALRALAADRLEITMLAPELKFLNRSMSVNQPFKPQRGRGLRLEDTAAELGAHWIKARSTASSMSATAHSPGRVRSLPTTAVLALGARPEREWYSREVLTYHGGRDGPSYRLLLHQLRKGEVNKLAFVKPQGRAGRCRYTTWR